MTNPAFKTYEVAVLFGQPVLFSYGRIDPEEVPDKVHLYELRHDSYNISEPMWIEQKVDCDYYGTIIAKDPIDLNGQYVSNTNTGEQVKP